LVVLELTKVLPNAEMLLGFQIWVGKQYCGGHNLPLLVGIGLTELPNSKWAKAHPAHPANR